MRLDRLVGKWLGYGKKRTREVFEVGDVWVNGLRVKERSQIVGSFDRVEVGGTVIQARERKKILLNKPSGYVSATSDLEHPTVLDLIKEDWAGELHLAGRLDRFTTGLVILTNDGRFSESLTDPDQKVGKRYLVMVDREIDQEVVAVLQQGMWFAKERVMTSPALVELLNPRQCRLTIFEGKHHQVKRMLAQFDLKVVSLHREAIGSIELPDDLASGCWREIA